MKTSLVTNKLHTRFFITTTKMKLLTLLMVLLSSLGWGQSAANYAFTFGSSSLNSMTGSTSLMTGVNDDAGSTVFPIGFNFIYMGTSYSHISVNSNGQARLHTSSGATAIGGANVSSYTLSTVTLAPMAGDNEVGNGMSFLVTGSAPNRKLIIEWNNFYANWSDPQVSGNMQLVLNETTGVFEYIYGNILNSSTSTVTKSVFHSSSNTANTSAFVTVAVTPTVNTSATSPTTNTFAASVPIANLANRAFTFTPLNTSTPSDPTSLTFTAVTATTITPNWVDNSSDEQGFTVTRANDAGFTNGVVVTNVASTTIAGTGTTYTLAQTGLTPGTTYFYKIQAFTEAGVGSGLTGSQATTAGATYYWTGINGGTFATTSNWNTLADGTGTAPTAFASTDVYIVDGAGTSAGGALTINLGASASVGQFKVISNTTLTLASSATAQRVITITGGAGDDVTIENGSSLLLTNTTNPISIIFSGTGNTGDISGVLTVAGTSTTASSANSFLTTGGTGTIVTVSSTGVINNTATSNISTNGNVTGSASSLVFASGSGYNVSGATGTGAFWLPLATWATTSTITVSGVIASTTGPSNNNQSFGNFVYNCPAATGAMSVFTSTTSAVIKGDLTITAGATGGTGIFRALTTGTLTVNGNVNVLQGRLQSASGSGIFNVLGNTTVSTNGILEINGGTYNQRGATFTNDGTLTAVAGSTRLAFAPLTSIAQTFAGSGTVLTNIGGLSLSNPAGLTITHTNQIITLRVNLFQGTIIGSNKITFGTGLALGCTTQIGSTGLTTPGGSFDASPSFNLGTGTYSVIYQEESVSRTTGFEIPPTRTVSNITNSNLNGVVLAGGNVSSAALTFSANCGNITTSSSNVLTITGTTTGAITRTSTTAFVNGPLELTLPASLATNSTYLFPIGKTALYPYELINPTTNAGGTVVVRAEVFDGNASGTAGSFMSSLSTSRYWAASISSGSSNLTNTNIRLTDAATTGFDAIANSATVTGAYDIVGGTTSTVTGTTILSTTPLTSLSGFYVMGSKAAPTFATPAITPSGNQCTNVSRAISVLITPGGGAVSTVNLNYSINGTAQTAIAMTNTTNTGGADTWTATLPTVAPVNAAITWSITANDANSLSRTVTGTGYQDEPTLGVTAAASASVNPVCVNTGTSLNMSLVRNGSAAIGAGLSATSSSGTSSTISPFSHYFGGYKYQYLIRASELTAAGFTAGNITGLSFDVTSSGVTYNGFTLSLANSSTNALNSSAFLTPTFTQVYTGNLNVNATGLFPIPFGIGSGSSANFNWDGTSNIVVNLCWSNNNGGGTAAEVKFDGTSFVSSAYFNSDNSTPASVCSSSVPSSSLSSRPRMLLVGNTPPTPTSYSWSDGSTVVGTTNSLVVNPNTATNYTGTAIVNGCPITASTTVTTNPCLATWTGTTSTDWNTTSNWNPAAVPTSADNIIIPATGITNFPVATGLTIAAGKTTTLNSNAQLTVNGTLTNNGTLTLESGATLVQGTGNTVAGSGTFNVKQALTGAGGATPSGRFWYLGSPVSTANSGVFNAAGDNRLWTHSEANLAYTEITANNVSMAPLRGHVVRLGANETSVFTGGLLNTGNYTNNTLTNSGTGTANGYTLVSNPYPSYLNWDDAYAGASGISSSIWYRTFNSTNSTMVFDIYNATGAVATSNAGVTIDKYIPPMQAFWIYNPTNGTSGSVTFSNSMRSHQNNGGLKDAIDFPVFVRLNLENDGAIDQTVLYFDNNAAAGYDNFDSDKMMLANFAQVYSFVDNKKLAINGMKSVKANKQVPLTVEFPTAKSYSFNATEVVMTDGIVILEDRLTKVFQDLTMNPVYNFDAAAGTDANRFVVHFQANSGVAGIETAEDNGIAIVSNASGLVTITLSEELPAMGTIQIIDINGKVIATQAINEQTTTMNINAATGVYHVLVDSASKVARKKIVITK